MKLIISSKYINKKLVSHITRDKSVEIETDWYDIIYLLTAIGLTPGGNSTVHIYT